MIKALTLEGFCRDGKIEPLEKLPEGEYKAVIVLLPFEKMVSNDLAYQALRTRIEEEYPKLREMTPKERREQFDRITQKVIKNLPFKTWNEMDKAVKGDVYGLT